MKSKAFGIRSAMTIRNASLYMTITYVVSLSVIALLSIIAHILITEVIAQQSKSGTMINVSGQQRMLSQRICLFVKEYLRSDSMDAKLVAEDALRTMKRNHAMLTKPHLDAIAGHKPSPMTPTLQALYFSEPLNVHEKIQRFTQVASKALADQTPEHGAEVNHLVESMMSMSRHPLLHSLDMVVKQYEKESFDRVSKLRTAQNFVLVIIILTILIEAFFVFRPMVVKVSEFARRVQYDANHDHLTGLLNRRAFFLLAEQSRALMIRNKGVFSTLMLDIDFFKNINDNYGHDTGDLAIKHVSRLLKCQLRASDIVARFGGEEFIVFLPDTDGKGAVSVGEKLRAALKGTPFSKGTQSIPMTISCGAVMATSHSNDLDNLISKADKALYLAKKTGRNKTKLYSEE